MLNPIQITFENYLIRYVREEDAENYFNLIEVNRELFKLYFPTTTQENKSVEETKQHLKKRLDLSAEKEFFTLVLEDRNTGKIIASIIIKDINWNIPKAELGFFIDAAYQGKGIISNSLKLLIGHLFSNWHFRKLFLRTSPENTGSKRVAEKTGFKLEGVLRNDFRSDGKLIDVEYYGLVPEDGRQT